MNDDIKNHNEELATALATLAEYIRMSEDKAKIKIGIQFRLKKQRMKFPVMPVEKTLKNVAYWASGEVIKLVWDYQKATGKEDGNEILEGFTHLRKQMGG